MLARRPEKADGPFSIETASGWLGHNNPGLARRFGAGLGADSDRGHDDSFVYLRHQLGSHPTRN